MKTNINTKGLSMPKSFLMQKNWRKNKPFNAKTELNTQKHLTQPKQSRLRKKTFLQKPLPQKLTLTFATKTVSFYFLRKTEPVLRKEDRLTRVRSAGEERRNGRSTRRCRRRCTRKQILKFSIQKKINYFCSEYKKQRSKM